MRQREEVERNIRKSVAQVLKSHDVITSVGSNGDPDDSKRQLWLTSFRPKNAIRKGIKNRLYQIMARRKSFQQRATTLFGPIKARLRDAWPVLPSLTPNKCWVI